MDEKEQSVEIGTDKSEETLLTQWQTCVEMANAVSQRSCLLYTSPSPRDI